MTNTEIDKYAELLNNAQDNELSKEDYQEFVQLTTVCVKQLTERVIEAADSLSVLEQEWGEVELLNTLLNIFLEDKGMIDEFKEFVDEMVKYTDEKAKLTIQ